MSVGLLFTALLSLPASAGDCDQRLAGCRQQLVQGYHLRAQLCLDDYLAVCPDHPQLDQAADLRVAAAALGDRSPVRRTRPPKSDLTRRPWVPESPLKPLLEADGPGQALERVMLSGVPEFLLTSSLVAAGQGALLSSAALTLARTPTAPSQNLLFAVPTLAAAGGLVAASATAWTRTPSTGQLASFSSALWFGSVEGGLLFVALRALDDDHRALPGQLLLWSAASGLGGVAGLGLATGFELEPGDVGLMNSAALWGGVLPLVFTAQSVGDRGAARSIWTAMIGSTLGYTAAFVAAPWIELERPATWLIDLGGALGLFASVAINPYNAGQPLEAALVGGGFTLAGLAMGSGACWLVHQLIRDQPKTLAVLSRWQLQPWVETAFVASKPSTLGGLRLALRF